MTWKYSVNLKFNINFILFIFQIGLQAGARTIWPFNHERYLRARKWLFRMSCQIGRIRTKCPRPGLSTNSPHSPSTTEGISWSQSTSNRRTRTTPVVFEHRSIARPSLQVNLIKLRTFVCMYVYIYIRKFRKVSNDTLYIYLFFLDFFLSFELYSTWHGMNEKHNLLCFVPAVDGPKKSGYIGNAIFYIYARVWWFYSSVFFFFFIIRVIYFLYFNNELRAIGSFCANGPLLDFERATSSTYVHVCMRFQTTCGHN